jgi:beta-glucosidase-like glycosyl hydrolase
VILDHDLPPFRAAIASQVASMMVAYAAYPALDASRSPAPLSTQVLRYLLREKLGFDGLIASDVLARTDGLTPAEEANLAVRALDAGCDLLLCPVHFAAIVDALEAALRDGPLDDDRILQSRRRRSKWAQWAAPPTEYRKASTSDLTWAAGLAERAVHLLRGERPTLGAAVEVVVVDDDAPPAAAAGARGAPFAEALRTPHVRVSVVDAPSDAFRGSVIVLVLGDDHPSKARSGYSEATIAAVRGAAEAARAAGRSSIVIQFSHPRLAERLGGVENIVCAWSRDPCMQEAAARWLLRTA